MPYPTERNNLGIPLVTVPDREDPGAARRFAPLRPGTQWMGCCTRCAILACTLPPLLSCRSPSLSALHPPAHFVVHPCPAFCFPGRGGWAAKSRDRHPSKRSAEAGCGVGSDREDPGSARCFAPLRSGKRWMGWCTRPPQPIYMLSPILLCTPAHSIGHVPAYSAFPAEAAVPPRAGILTRQ